MNPIAWFRPPKKITEGWQPDDDVSACQACGEPFSFIRRKHHCRDCGRIFCDEHARVRYEWNVPKRLCECCLEIYREGGQRQQRQRVEFSTPPAWTSTQVPLVIAKQNLETPFSSPLEDTGKSTREDSLPPPNTLPPQITDNLTSEAICDLAVRRFLVAGEYLDLCKHKGQPHPLQLGEAHSTTEGMDLQDSFVAIPYGGSHQHPFPFAELRMSSSLSACSTKPSVSPLAFDWMEGSESVRCDSGRSSWKTPKAQLRRVCSNATHNFVNPNTGSPSIAIVENFDGPPTFSFSGRKSNPLDPQQNEDASQLIIKTKGWLDQLLETSSENCQVDRLGAVYMEHLGLVALQTLSQDPGGIRKRCPYLVLSSPMESTKTAASDALSNCQSQLET